MSVELRRVKLTFMACAAVACMADCTDAICFTSEAKFIICYYINTNIFTYLSISGTT
jgi:hypothetical protein